MRDETRMTTERRVVVSGASIAGPAIAYWLSRCGYAVTVVEKASRLRPGGQAVDFKGLTHRTVLHRMGVLDEVLAGQTGGHDQTVVDAGGRCLAVIPGAFTGGEIEIARGDLSEILYRRTAPDCEYLFGDSIRSIEETSAGVQVEFDHAAPRTFDLVVGADGIHSHVRRLAFGPESDHVTFLGHYYALADVNVPGEGVMYNEPGRMVAVGGPKASAFFVFRSDEVEFDRDDTDQQKELLRRAYAGGAWRVGELMDRVEESQEFYLDSLSKAWVDRFHRGRVVLLGDAAHGNTLGGFGTGLAVVGAYVLAGELCAAAGDHDVAFERYDQLMRPYAKIARSASAGAFLAPATRSRIWLRNLTFRSPLLLRAMLKVTDSFATGIELPDYPVPIGAPPEGAPATDRAPTGDEP